MLDYYLTPDPEINSTWIKEQNFIANTIELLEENLGTNFHDLRFST